MGRIRASPLFSVVIPTRNRARLLRRCVESVLRQRYGDFEVIVVNDASTDETEEMIRTCGDRRVSGLRLVEHTGVAAARNVGILRARGRYVAFLDDDDEYMPEFLQAMYGVLTRAPKNTAFAWCGVQRVRDDPGGEQLVETRLWDIAWTPPYRPKPEALRQALCIGASFGVTVRADCLQNLGLFDHALKAGEDTAFLLKLLAGNGGFVSVPEALVKTHDHDGARLSDAPNDGPRLDAITWMLAQYVDWLARNLAAKDLLSKAAAIVRRRLPPGSGSRVSA